MIDYVVLGTLLFYFFIVKVFSSSLIGVRTAAIAAALVPFIFSTTLQGIILSSYGAPFFQSITVGGVITLVLQILLAWFVFRRMVIYEESLTAWIAWVVAGCVGIYFIVPWMVGAVLLSF